VTRTAKRWPLLISPLFNKQPYIPPQTYVFQPHILYMRIMQRFRVVYHGISHEPLAFSRYTREPLGEYTTRKRDNYFILCHRKYSGQQINVTLDLPQVNLFLILDLFYLSRAKRESNLRATKSRGRARAT